MTRFSNASFFQRAIRGDRRSAVSKPDKYWRARPASEAVDVTSDLRDENRRALLRRRTKMTPPAQRGAGRAACPRQAERRRHPRATAHVAGRRYSLSSR
jgi:hypothetical protein